MSRARSGGPAESFVCKKLLVPTMIFPGSTFLPGNALYPDQICATIGLNHWQKD